MAGFNSYWSFFDIFLKCTVYFSRLENSWPDLHNSISEKCTRFQCVTLQTSEKNVTARISRLENGTDAKLLQDWSSSDFQDLIPIYRKVFLSQKFQTVCSVQLVSVEANYQHEEVGFRHPDNNLFEIEIYSARPSIRDYILLPIHFTKNDSTKIPTIPGPTYTTSKIIVLNSDYEVPFIACLTCYDDDDSVPYIARPKHGLAHLKRLPLKKFRFTPKSLEEIDKLWLYYHSNQINKIVNEKYVVKYNNIYHDAACTQSTEFSLVYHRNERDCLKDIIFNFYNISGDIRRQEQRHSPLGYEYISAKRGLHARKGLAILANSGIRFHGIRYVMINRADGKHVGNDLFLLLSPFKIYDWIVISASLICISLILKVTGYQHQVLFWIFASLLEQGDWINRYINWKNKHLVIFWLFTALIIRNIYTSDIYSCLTMKLDPTDMPKNMYDLLFNHNLPLLTGSAAKNLISDALNRDGNFHGVETYRKIYNSLNATLLSVMVLSDPKEVLEGIGKGMPLEIRRSWNPELKMEKEIKWSRFALLYHTSIFEGNILFFKPAISAYADSTLYNNNEEPILTIPRVWYWKCRFFFSFTFERALQALDESGIMKWHEKQLAVFSQKIQLEEVKYYVGTKNLDYSPILFASFIISKRYSSSEMYGEEAEVSGVEMLDCVVAWSAYGLMLAVTIVSFIIERSVFLMNTLMLELCLKLQFNFFDV
ncbi:unnamed protein product [Orchesella dallaii]|uniref:Meckelin n=1 Tax=Orchesella dallaii TaxID=48710 RepID=A0ABP1PSZ4_9HEXA